MSDCCSHPAHLNPMEELIELRQYIEAQSYDEAFALGLS